MSIAKEVKIRLGHELGELPLIEVSGVDLSEQGITGLRLEAGAGTIPVLTLALQSHRVDLDLMAEVVGEVINVADHELLDLLDQIDPDDLQQKAFEGGGLGDPVGAREYLKAIKEMLS